MSLIAAWIIGLLSVFLPLQHSLFIGLIRGFSYKFEMSMPVALRVVWGGVIGYFSWAMTSFVWSLVFSSQIPALFVFLCVLWSAVSLFLMGNWEKLQGLSKGNELAMVLGGLSYLLLSFIENSNFPIIPWLRFESLAFKHLTITTWTLRYFYCSQVSLHLDWWLIPMK